MAELSNAAAVALDAEQATTKRNVLLTMPSLVIITIFGIVPLFVIDRAEDRGGIVGPRVDHHEHRVFHSANRSRD